MGVREEAEPLGRGFSPEIPPPVADLLRSQRVVVAATVDGDGRPWASLLTGPAGFVKAVDETLVHLAVGPRAGDPLAENLRSRPDLGLLIIDLATRQRIRVNGRGMVSPDGLFLLAERVYGNCRKYIQKRRILGARTTEPGRMGRSATLDPAVSAFIEASDTFFIATWHPAGGADASHRGGRPGFVRVLDGGTLEFPDYPGNNMFNTLGNLAGHPHVGLLFADFETGDLVQIAGGARILWTPERAVRVTVEDVVTRPAGCPLRFELIEPFVANPPLSVTSGTPRASEVERREFEETRAPIERSGS